MTHGVAVGVGGRVGATVGRAVGGRVGATVGGDVGGRVGAAVTSGVGSAVGANVGWRVAMGGAVVVAAGAAGLDETPADTAFPHAARIRNEPAAARRAMVEARISILSSLSLVVMEPSVLATTALAATSDSLKTRRS
jgi:hypothetical protein